MSFSQRRILVTGGAGFIGTHLCRRLVAEGAWVLCVDDFSTGSKHNAAELLAHDNFELMRWDVAEPMRHIRVDQIFHLACPASPKAYQRHPIRTIETCVVGTRNVLELAMRCRARVVHASTSEVYGDPDVTPQDEDYVGRVPITGPRSCYDEGKRCAEALCWSYRSTMEEPLRVARIFNTYGPGMAPDDGRVVSNFVVRALRRLPLVITGNGAQTRSFCYIDDTVDALCALMAYRGDAHVVNVGNPRAEISIADLAQRVLKLVGGDASDVRFVDMAPHDPRQRRPDIGRARSALCWDPTTDLDSGLRRTIHHFARVIDMPWPGALHALADGGGI